MAKYIVLYNLKAGHATTDDDVKRINEVLDGEKEFVDISSVESYEMLFNGLSEGETVVLCGGDGTLNRFANDTYDIEYPCSVLYYPIGTGNDFAADLGKAKGCEPFEVNQYLKNLPTVTVNGKTYRFINGIGYGIDGYCCEVGDELKKVSDKPVNYTAIAIKGLLFHYKTTNARVTVDGDTREYKRVWLAPTMFGRFYGGGMNPTPGQTRNDRGTVANMVFHGAGKIKSLIVFPSLFKGEHIKHREMVEVRSGKTVTVEYDRPVALQIDGETILGVTSYTVSAADFANNGSTATAEATV